MNSSNSKLKPIFLLILFVLNVLPIHAQGFDHSHSVLDGILKKNIVNGLVNYKSLSQNRKQLTEYLKNISAVTESEYKDFNKQQKMAFLINAYNAYTLELILNHYPIKSIGDIGGPIRLINLGRGTPWKSFKFPFLGNDRNLDWIEHSKLRLDFDDPRIHFAINCASIGCPALSRESYKAKNLDFQLKTATVGFLLDSEKNSYNKDKNTLTISKIFEWFKGDFEKRSGTIIKFIQPYFKETIPNDVKIEYSDYDWNLNDIK
jgi:hypothetical protein